MTSAHALRGLHSAKPFRASAATVPVAAVLSITLSLLLSACTDGSNGAMGTEGAAGPPGPAGETGPAGPAGPVGPEGPAGAKGATGATGPVGATGATGATGPSGPVGPGGATGPIGPAGPKGATGPAGPTGATGPIGATGATGATGAAGPVGATGAAGPVGPAGAAGVAGPTGATGATGAIGPAGVAGPIGPAGAAGVAGPAGVAGATGAVGPAGVAGPAGPAGPIGPAGPNTLQNGSAAAPSLNFANSPTTGLFRSGTDTFDIATSGVKHLEISPAGDVFLGGELAQFLGMAANPTAGAAGNALTLTAGDAATGATDQLGGNLLLEAGNGTGLGGGGNVQVRTAGANDLSGSTGDLTVDRLIVVAKGKQLTLSAPGFTSLMSIHLVGTNTAGGYIDYTVRATDGGSQIATESGKIQYLATANSITCTVQTTDKLHLGTVNSGCTPGFFNPGSQPGVSIFDNVTFSSPAAIVTHEVYFTVHNNSGSSIRLEP